MLFLSIIDCTDCEKLFWRASSIIKITTQAVFKRHFLWRLFTNYKDSIFKISWEDRIFILLQYCLDFTIWHHIFTPSVVQTHVAVFLKCLSLENHWGSLTDREEHRRNNCKDLFSACFLCLALRNRVPCIGQIFIQLFLHTYFTYHFYCPLLYS